MLKGREAGGRPKGERNGTATAEGKEPENAGEETVGRRA